VPDNHPTDYRLILKDGRFDTQADASPERLQAMFKQIRNEAPGHLVLHFHGGLISRAAGEAAADRLGPDYRGAGALPLFIIWESGPTEIIDQRLSAIADEGIFQTIMSRVTRFVGGKLDKELGPEGGKEADQLPLPFQVVANAELAKGKAGGKMFADRPVEALPPESDHLQPMEQQQIKDELAADPNFEQHLRALDGDAALKSGSKDVGAASMATTLMDPAVLAELHPATSQQGASKSLFSTAVAIKRVLDVVGRVIWRFAHQRHHGVYLTIVEEVLRAFYIGPVGKFFWDGMKSAIENAFTKPNAGGTALVEALNQIAEDKLLHKITLVGHSAGAIYAARLLKELDAKLPSVCKVNLVLIAPACTFNMLADVLRTSGGRVAGLRIFGMGDPIELRDEIVPLVYPASLLYFVSGVLEQESDEPLVGMQRFYNMPSYNNEDFADIKDTKAFDYLKRQHAFAWSDISGLEGASSDMKSHGGWVDAEQTRQSVMSIIQNGYGYA
jgi:hypothetical protein